MNPTPPALPAGPAAPVPTIVCVDDDLPMLRTLREQLRRGLGKHCDVEVASGGHEALQLLAELTAEGVHVPLLISDHNMPGMRGATLLASAHALYPDLLTILLTGQADIDAVSHAVNQGNLYRLLAKPWHEADLIGTVKEALRRVDLDRQLAQRTAALAASSDKLERSLRLLQATMDATPDGLLVLGRDGLPLQINRQLAELWSLPGPIVQDPAQAALLDCLRSQLQDAGVLQLDAQADARAPMVLALKDGRAVEYSSLPYRVHGERIGAVYSFRDVTERERSARRIRHQALHDTLSGLPNRLQFGQALDQAIVQARDTGDCLAVLFLDLDHFKRINDSLGHDVGDRLLQAAAARLSQCLRTGDLIARWGGDEFTVLAPKVRSADEAEALAGRILQALETPFVLDGVPLQISASVGVARYPADGEDGQSLLRRADMALYKVKDGGRNGMRSFRHSEFAELEQDAGLSLENDLRSAIERGELELHYQPQIDTRTGRITKVEALARWHHARRGWIGPDVFIPIAERTGAIVALGQWVLDTACRQAAQWRAQGLDQACVAVNLSAVQFDRCDLQAVVLRALSASGLPTQALELEVTEALALRHMTTTSATLAALRQAGVRVALDDFGTGYASLTYLKQLPFDTLKIDRSFVDGLQAGSADAVIIGALVALVALADGLGLDLVAEGVETQQVCDELQALGCRTMQGYLFSRPLAAAAMTEFWHARATTPATPAPCTG